MELREFIEVTLRNVADGIISANKDRVRGRYMMVCDDKIHFDVAVTVREDTTVEGGGKVSIFALKIGAEGGASSGSESVSRIVFEVRARENIEQD